MTMKRDEKHGKKEIKVLEKATLQLLCSPLCNTTIQNLIYETGRLYRRMTPEKETLPELTAVGYKWGQELKNLIKQSSGHFVQGDELGVKKQTNKKNFLKQVANLIYMFKGIFKY